jgi:CDP-diacylglycerol--glycerol-3-phosphate 3-phosphatidyltransferase
VAKSAWQEPARRALDPIVAALARAGATPTGVTLFGLALNIAAGVVVGLGHPVLAGLTLILAGVCDALDGQLARRTGRTSRFGAFLDSTIDRIDETAVLAGIAAWFLRSGRAYAGELAIVCFVALAGSIITSYTRARAEGLGLECKVGSFERPERVVVTIAGLLFGAMALTGAVLLIALMSWVTVVQRIVHVRREAEDADRAGTPWGPTATTPKPPRPPAPPPR